MSDQILWKGKDFTRKTAEIKARKLGKEWKVEDSPYESGRFVVTRTKTKEEINE
jgi:hypothetical protein